MIEKFTFDLLIKDKRKRLILVKAVSEQRDHIVLKLLSYLYFYTPGLQVEVDIGTHYKPDLIQLGPDGNPQLWIDCGYISIVKGEALARKLRHSKVVFVKPTLHEATAFRNLMIRRDAAVERIQFLCFEDRFISSIADALERKTEVTLYPIHEDVYGVAINNQIFESRFIFLPEKQEPAH